MKLPGWFGSLRRPPGVKWVVLLDGERRPAHLINTGTQAAQQVSIGPLRGSSDGTPVTRWTSIEPGHGADFTCEVTLVIGGSPAFAVSWTDEAGQPHRKLVGANRSSD